MKESLHFVSGELAYDGKFHSLWTEIVESCTDLRLDFRTERRLTISGPASIVQNMDALENFVAFGHNICTILCIRRLGW